jgi:hypothetical protein
MALFDAPEKTLKLIRSYNVKPLDPNKETMALIFSRLVFSKEQDHIIGWYRQMVKEVLEPRFNLIWLGVDNDPSRLVDMGFSNIYSIHHNDFEEIKAKKFKRAAEVSEDDDNLSWEHNRDVVIHHFNAEMPKYTPEYVMWLDERWAFLPLKDYWAKRDVSEKIRTSSAVNKGNEFHDYIGNDPEIIDFIHKNCKKISAKYDYHVGILTFTYWMKNLAFNLGKWCIDNAVANGNFKRSYYYVVDPGSYYRLFDSISPAHTNFALARDYRGTRDFEAFPVAEMQHFLYDKPWETDKTKKHKFCFYGTVFLSKNTRRDVWNTYLRNLRGDGIDIYVPPKVDGHISERKKENRSVSRFQKRIEEDPIISELWESVSTHPNYRGYIDTQELNGTLAKYEYSLVAKNIAHYDIINWRPALYLSLDVFPLLDYRYDPEFLGIPEWLQKKIVVHDHEEILERIAYYDSHPEEKAQVMHELKEHFNYYNFLEEWKTTVKQALKIVD